MFTPDLGKLDKIEKYDVSLTTSSSNHCDKENMQILYRYFPNIPFVRTMSGLEMTAYVVIACFNIKMDFLYEDATMSWKWFILEKFDGHRVIMGKTTLRNALELEKASEYKRVILNAYNYIHKSGDSISSSSINVKKDYTTKLSKYKPSMTTMINYIANRHFLTMETINNVNKTEVNSNLQADQLINTANKLSMSGIPWMLADKNTIVTYNQKANNLIVYTMQPGIS
jgi:hypothetical protein